MSILDKVVAAVTPRESEQARVEARAKAHDAAEKGSWFGLALEHHDLLRAASRELRSAGDARARTTALRNLCVLLLGHAQAEESVLYPTLAACDDKARAEMGYNEQAMVKMQMEKAESQATLTRRFREESSVKPVEGVRLWSAAGEGLSSPAQVMNAPRSKAN